MTKIQIRKVNGVPMGRPVNPTRRLEINSHSVYSAEDIFKNNDCYDHFEQSVTEHEAPGCEEGEAGGHIQSQYYTHNKYWKNCDAEDAEYFKGEGYITRQIWIVSTPEKVEAQPGDICVGQWISVKDRLPEVDGDFLIITKSKKYMVCGYYKDDSHWFNYIPVTHWQPLPSPPTH